MVTIEKGRNEPIGEDKKEGVLAQTDFKLLLVVIKAVAEAPDFDSALEAALRLICRYADCAFGEVWLYEPALDVLRLSPIYYQRDPDDDRLRLFRQASQMFTYRRGKGLPGRVWFSKEPEWLHNIEVPDLSEDKYPRLKKVQAAGLKAVLGIPIIANGEVLAVLVFVKAEPWSRDERVVELVSAVARQLGGVLQRKKMEEQLRQAYEALGIQVEKQTAVLTYMNATLTEQYDVREQVEAEVRQRNQELAALNSISAAVSTSLELPKILHSLKNLFIEQLNLPGGAIFFYHKAEDILELKANWGFPAGILPETARFAVAGSPFEPVIENQAILHTMDFHGEDLLVTLSLDKARPDWHSYLCVPLVAKGTIQGILCIFSRAPAAFSENQVTFFKTVGQQVGVAIQNVRLFEEVLAGRERLRQLTQQVVSAQEAERHRVSRELHDEAGQALTVLKFTLQMMLANLPAQEATVNSELIRPHLMEAIGLCETTMEGIRLLAHDLRPAALDDLGLNLTLEGFCHDFAEHTNLSIEYSGVEGLTLPETAEICLYRFLQEALTNVARHAAASGVWVTLYRDGNAVSLAVKDNGCGFDAQRIRHESNQPKGMGLAGMRERLELLGGWLEVTSRPGQGTHLVAWVPDWEAK